MEERMAQRVQIILEDDYDGGTADETVSFALDGAEYEIDLSSKNAAGLRDALAPWLARARKTGGRRKRTTKASGSSSTSDIRAWAQAQGLDVSSRGRVSAEVREAYEKAHAS
jgi:Lsr2